MFILSRKKSYILCGACLVTIIMTGTSKLFSFSGLVSRIEDGSLWAPMKRTRVDDSPSPSSAILGDSESPSESATESTYMPWDSVHFVQGDPTPRFRDNIRNDTYYLTSWANAGFTNQFMSLVNLIYLAILTERVAVLPPFAPDHHISWDGGIITFGEIFDLPHLRAALHKPVLEWKDLKQLPLSTSSKPFDTSEVEEIGCWSTRKEADPHPIPARMFIRHLGLDPSYTRVPGSTRKSQDKNDDHVVFASLAALVYPPTTEGQQKSSFSLPASGYPVLEAGRLSSHKRSPEDKLTCFDFLYYATSGAESFEWNYPWSPAWNQVGRHVRFNWWMVERSEGYLRRAFGLDKDQAIPPFIAIHIRHGDFHDNCGLSGHCLSSPERFAEKVEEVESSLLETKGIAIKHWLVSSDETDRNFWVEVERMGWNYFDHEEERTLELYGEWQALLVDMVAHSLATGFVGTADSTFSLVGGRRVESWNDGPYRLVE